MRTPPTIHKLTNFLSLSCGFNPFLVCLLIFFCNPSAQILTTPLGQTQHSYDSESRLIQTIHPNGNTETFAFNSAGYLSEKKDNSRRLVITSNESGQVVEVLELIRLTYPDMSTEEILRDVMGRPIKITYTASISGSGGILPSQSDPNSLSTPTPSEELFLSYSQAGDLLKIESKRNFFRDGQPVTSESQSIIQSFDILGRLTSRTLPFLHRQVEYEYNAASELITKREINTQTQAVRTTQYGYTIKGQLASLNENGSTTLFEYSPGGKITKITYPEGISLAQSYNGFGELESQIWKNPSDETLHQILYEYNLNGKVTRITTPEGITEHSYDSESRLVQTIHPDIVVEDFRPL